ncbi:nitroreductase family protein [Sphingomonas pseudosanguinis]|uniref:Putative NAD(P)H nitroreductase n=1 Tax=Sphingomonas pseudosanguinis TaxID=413712 RepID=A0A7W6A5Y2_9SPHN|nr:nitroreductase [Sphingomonas pseudosanguinis]MBB3877744.1 nitroreductase [Sphingomonas pseudosanguinis]MBN3537622.1 nitroreductase [Sphingomonas pseudosanguinis]
MSDMAFNDRSTPLTLLETRRSGKPRDLIAPGPDADQLDHILRIAARTPDHGKLAPWRFVIVADDARAKLAEVITTAYRAERPQASATEIAALEQFAHQAPSLVVVLSSPRTGSHIPLWEQELSAGAACMNLLHAAHAMGFAGGWLTGWPSFSDAVRDAFGQAPERIAGFLFLGTPGRPLDERPRPDMEAIVSHWTGPVA